MPDNLPIILHLDPICKHQAVWGIPIPKPTVKKHHRSVTIYLDVMLKISYYINMNTKKEYIMKTLSNLQQLVDSRLQSLLDGKPESIKAFAEFYMTALFHPTTMRSLVIASLLERLNKNSDDYQKSNDSGVQWKYKIQQDHILVMLAQAMPPQLQTKLPLIN